MRTELNTIYRSFPELRELRGKALDARQAAALAGKVLGDVARLCGEEAPAWQRQAALAALTVRYYPEAKRYLVAQGRTEKEVEALPTLQVVALYFLDRYDRTRDDIQKWLAVPAWQGLGPLAKLEKQARAQGKAEGNVLLVPLGLLMPAITKSYAAQLRLGRQVAGLRGAEALRLHAAAHGGLPPAKWADVTEAPEPIDPITGKGVGEWYALRDGKGVLSVPAPPGQGGSVGRRYELAGGKEP